MSAVVRVYYQGKYMRPIVLESEHITIGDRIAIDTLFDPIKYKVTGINHVCGVIKSIEVN